VNASLVTRVHELAGDVGRLRRRVSADTVGAYLADRIAGHVEAIATMLEPTAAELAATWAPGDDEAVAEAIRTVDELGRRLQTELGRETS
jgi:hypothetical protein